MSDKHRIEIKPVMVTRETAAKMLANISPRTLDAMVLEGLIYPRRLRDRRIGYLVREIEALADGLPVVVPGVES